MNVYLAYAVAFFLVACGKTADSPAPDTSKPSPAEEKERPKELRPEDVKQTNSVVGLEKLATQMLDAVVEDERQAELDTLLYSLRLPKYKKWFKKHFDDDLATLLAQEYRPFHDNIGLLQNLLLEIANNKQDVIVATSYGEPKPDADGIQARALPLRKAKTGFRLYSIRFADSANKRAFHIWYFVHHKGSFRYVGKLSKASGA